jgi:predicted amidophosphoribosyltransferase
MPKCYNCGAEIKANKTRCPKCGAKVEEGSGRPPEAGTVKGRAR